MKTQEQAVYEQLLDEQRALTLKLRAAYNAWMASLQPGDVLVIFGSPAIYLGRDGDRLLTLNADGNPQPITLRREFGIPRMIPYDAAESTEKLAWHAIVAQEIQLEDGAIEESTYRMMAVDPKTVEPDPNRVSPGLIHDRVEKMKALVAKKA